MHAYVDTDRHTYIRTYVHMYMHMQESMRMYVQKKRTPGHDMIGGGSRPNDLGIQDDRLNATSQCMHLQWRAGHCWTYTNNIAVNAYQCLLKT